MKDNAYPEQLFTGEVWVARPSPQSPREEAALRVRRCPSETGSGPLLRLVVLSSSVEVRVLECLEGVLLIV